MACGNLVQIHGATSKIKAGAIKAHEVARQPQDAR